MEKWQPVPSSQEARTLRDYEAWKTSLRNFTWLHHVAPGATDLDVVIERRGHFLVLETKHWQEGVKVPLGQHILLAQLSALEPFTVFLVGEKADDGEDSQCFEVVPYLRYAPMARGAFMLFPPSIFEPKTRDDMRQLVRQWITAL